jgi:N-glycosylase/DNA lyase
VYSSPLVEPFAASADASYRATRRLGAQAFRAELARGRLAEDLVNYKLFEAGHTGVDYWYPMPLAWLCGRIAK